MPVKLQVMLFLGAILTMFYFIYQIRKKEIKIEYAISWGVFSAVLVLLGTFPEIVNWAAKIIEVESPVNLLYLVIIFIVIVKQFYSTLKLSKMDCQITALTQKIAIAQYEEREKEKETMRS